MEGSVHNRITDIESFMKRSWPRVLAGAVFVIIVIAFFLMYAINGWGRQTPSAAASSDPQPVVTSSTSTNLLVPRHLDGVPVALDQANLQPYAVMVENLPDARPLSGLAHANLVIEAPVEGGITRFMAVFDATTTLDQIGPVRSARPYFVEFADALKAAYAHVGGSDDALNAIKAITGFRNLDEMANGKYFWRSGKRPAPHNVYTRTDLLHQADAEKKWTAGDFVPWKYLDTGTTSTDRGDISSISIPYGGSYDVTWKYDRATNAYTRYQAGTIQTDSDGSVVTSTNVIVLQTDAQVLDDKGRLHVRTTGSGKGNVYRDGKKFDVTWRRSVGGWFTFETVDGNDALFEPGTSWISIVTSADQLTGVATSTSR